MLKAHKYRLALPLKLLIAFLLFQTQPVQSSGVFELEFIRLEQLELDSKASLQNSQSAGLVPATSANKSHQLDPNKLMRIFVCLKEAFTSHLDGPCTFGNASINLQRDSLQLAAPIKPQTTGQVQGSLLTNIVRIPFTFRWTKSFTIILSSEQLPGSFTNNTGSTASRQSHAVDSSPVDRHVLTENEVLPNLEGNPNKLWSNRFSRSLHSSLAYRFRVYCSHNYYGDGCATFCRPRDDQFGHYNCSSTGQKLCIGGWFGHDCDQAKCRQGCNPKHGFCDKPDTCECRHGWTGPRCDECITYPGCQHGYCLSPWQCICQRNWGGVLCDQDLNYCGTHNPCKNNATCQNVEPGKYKCTCAEGFEGTNCDQTTSEFHSTKPSSSIPDLAILSAGCALNPCLNGGTCYALDTEYPKDLQDMDGSRTDTLGQSHRCHCSPGWSGDFCQWPDTTSFIVINSTQETQDQVINQTRINPPLAPPQSPPLSLDYISSGEGSALDYPSPDTDPILNTLVEVRQEHRKQQATNTQYLDMKHLISGVMIASVVGVFLALLLLAWCCLIAIERNRLPFIQMNIISNRAVVADDQRGASRVVGSLKRMHERIRDSLRRSASSSGRISGSIKPDTKLSIENVLRPPPSYEESKTYDKPRYPANASETIQFEPEEEFITKASTVRGALEQKLAASRASSEASIIKNLSHQDCDKPCGKPVSRSQLECPRHGHLYRQHIAANYLGALDTQDYHWISTTEQQTDSLPLDRPYRTSRYGGYHRD